MDSLPPFVGEMRKKPDDYDLSLRTLASLELFRPASAAWFEVQKRVAAGLNADPWVEVRGSFTRWSPVDSSAEGIYGELRFDCASDPSFYCMVRPTVREMTELLDGKTVLIDRHDPSVASRCGPQKPILQWQLTADQRCWCVVWDRANPDFQMRFRWCTTTW